MLLSLSVIIYATKKTYSLFLFQKNAHVLETWLYYSLFGCTEAASKYTATSSKKSNASYEFPRSKEVDRNSSYKLGFSVSKRGVLLFASEHVILVHNGQS